MDVSSVSPPDRGALPRLARAEAMVELLRSHDWRKTPLGPLEGWPKSLLGYLSMVLEMPTPAIIFWGEAQTQLYNEGYAAIMGPRHPQYFGGTYRDCWPDTYPVIYPWMRRVLDHGEVIQVDKEHITVTRYGFTEEAFFTFTFSPLRDDAGRIAGIFQPVFEVTQAVLRERRGNTLRALASRTHLSDGFEELRAAFSSDAHDLPFVVFYRSEPGAGAPVELFRTGLEPSALPPSAATSFIREVMDSGAAVELEDVTALLGRPHHGPWPEQTGRALALPVRRAPSEAPYGVLLCGLSPRLRFDAPYREFLEAVARELAVTLAERELQLREEATRREVEASRNRLLALFEHAPFFVCALTGPRHVYELVNAPYRRAVGEGRPLLGLSVREALPELVEQGFADLLDEVYRTGEPYAGNESLVRLARADGGGIEDTYMNFLFQPRRNARGEVEGIDTFGFEVTEQVLARRRVEALAHELRRSEEQFRTVAEALPDAVWTADATGAVTYVNGVLSRYTGRGETDLMGDNHLELIHPDHRARSEAQWRETTRTGTAFEIEHPVLGADGHYRWHLRRALPVRDEAGQIVKWVGTSTDIHALREAQSQLREAVKARDTFLSVASHELRTPLTSLHLKVSHWLRSLGPSGGAITLSSDEVQRLFRQVKRLTHLVEELLDVSRIGSGQLRLDLETVDLGALVSDVVSRFELEAARVNCPLELAPASAPLTGRWDRSRLEQVVSNLLSNALKYGAGAPIRVGVSGDANRVRLVVEDAGIGIEPAVLPRIFEKFERGVSDRNYGGLGLGLFVTQQIVRALRGEVRVQSLPGRGATFTVELPRETVRAEEPSG